MSRARSFEIVMGLVTGLVFGVGFYYLLEYIPVFGRHLTSPNIIADYYVGVFTAIGMTVFTLAIPCRENERFSLIMIWGCRSLVTLLAMLYYEYTYRLDSNFYFTTAIGNEYSMDGSLAELSGTMLVSKIARIIIEYVPFVASYHALKVIWSFFGYLGSYIFYRAYVNYTGKSDIRLMWFLGIFPSIIFWSSIFGKDPITFFGISLIIYGSLPLFNKFSLWHMFIFAMGLTIAGYIRFWLVSLFLAPFMLLYVFRSRVNLSIKALTSVLSVALFVFFLGNLLEQIQVDDQEDAVNTASSVSRRWSRGGSGQRIESFNSITDIVKFMPVGMFTALFRPLPGEVNNVTGTLAGIENAVILIMFLIAVAKSNAGLRKDVFAQYAVAILLVWSAFYGFISYQNLGTAFRFRLQILPIMVLLLYHARQIRSQTTEAETVQER